MLTYILLLATIASGFVSTPMGVNIAIAPITPANAEEVRAAVAPSGTSPVKAVHTVWVTAYSSTPEQTDDTPFITASGRHVRDGTLASNFLPFGAKVKIPAAFGDKIFTVEDRMHSKKTNFVDVWMPSKEEALLFGVTYTEIYVLVLE